ncbi:hypothetical protein [Roseomonas marmotae]|uniref:OmpA-like domain-containing protein n=1 Tax=Roseomonas marmotae TaxID=2768161 RepID=A0ABS3KCL1_9PROT|nr:hypothetical protein [Roseomonas marmotae]MBO1074732.1 hypothetical protein [Roseomonas marmotae]QTI77805.1 hypothetical protein IAI58_08545 [Roseomonas marmotae]
MRFRYTFPAPPLRRRVLLALPLGLLLAAPALAQVGAPTGLRRQPEAPAPSDPAPAAPAPPDLNQPPRPAAPPQQLSMVNLPPSMRSLPDGGWRIEGMAANGKLDPATTNTLAEIGRRLAAETVGRVVVVAQVVGPAEDISVARRASLASAQAIRRALEAGGLPGTRIDLRPLGRTAAAEDAIELLPPGAVSPSLAAQSQ